MGAMGKKINISCQAPEGATYSFYKNTFPDSLTKRFKDLVTIGNVNSPVVTPVDPGRRYGEFGACHGVCWQVQKHQKIGKTPGIRQTLAPGKSHPKLKQKFSQ